MKHLKKRPFFVLVAILSSLLTNCSDKNKIKGNWIFDRSYTEEQLDLQTSGKKEGFGDLLSRTVINKMEGITLKIDNKEIVYMMKNGSGQSFGYEIIDTISDNVWSVKSDDGKISEWGISNKYLTIRSEGDIDMKAYFTRKN